MTIKELKDILSKAPDENKEVYIPHLLLMPTSGSIHEESSTYIGFNFDDDGFLELYIIAESEEAV